MSANIMELLMIVFNDEDAAGEALKELKEAKKEARELYEYPRIKEKLAKNQFVSLEN